MVLGKKKLLAGFLEGDNLKFLVYEGKTRVFAGQITFAPETVREAFIADAGKFSNQVKVAFAQKPMLREVTDVALFLPPDKTFTKTMDVADSVDGFIQSLPYFKEELLINNNQETRNLPHRQAGKKQNMVTYVAFEKKLVEDLQRPFLESGKTIISIESSVNDLVLGLPQEGEYFLLAAFEKEVSFAVVSNGGISEAASFKNDVFVTRFGEFVMNHNLGTIKTAYTVGIFPSDLAEKVHHAQGLMVSPLTQEDIYDLVVGSYLKLSAKFDLSFLSEILKKFPSQKRLFLVGAAVAGFVLVVLVMKNLPSGGSIKKEEVVSPVTIPVVQEQVQPKASDFKVRILNGTLVEGEAGKLADKIKAEGFIVSETKNATTAGFVATRLRITKEVPDKITATVKTILDQVYESTNVEPLASDSGGVKIEIIIGKKK